MFYINVLNKIYHTRLHGTHLKICVQKRHILENSTKSYQDNFLHTRRGRFEDCDVVGCAGEDGLVVVDVVDVHGHREVRHALLQPFVKLRRDLFLREWKHGEFEQPVCS